MGPVSTWVGGLIQFLPHPCFKKLPQQEGQIKNMVIIKNMFKKDLFLNRNFRTDSWAMNAGPKNCSRSTGRPRRAPADNKFRIAMPGPKRRAHGTGTPFSRSEIHCVGFIDQVDPNCNSVCYLTLNCKNSAKVENCSESCENQGIEF